MRLTRKFIAALVIGVALVAMLQSYFDVRREHETPSASAAPRVLFGRLRQRSGHSQDQACRDHHAGEPLV